MRTTERDAQVRELFKKGLKGREIAAAVGISTSNVWAIARRLKLPNRTAGHTRLPGIDCKLRSVLELARTIGPVEFEAADRPNGAGGYIAFIGDKPGEVRATKVAALRSAIALR